MRKPWPKPLSDVCHAAVVSGALRVLIGLVLAASLNGCITTVPTPTYARSGDLVQIGLGGIKRNSTGESLTGAHVSATIVDSNSDSYPVMVVGLFRAYPDYTSWYARDSLDRADGFFGNVEPYDGMWWATLKLADNSGPLPLAIGPATVMITSSELIDTGWAQEGTLADFPIEILPGTTTPSTEQEYQYAAYRHQRSLTVTPDTLAGITAVGGFQIKLTYNDAAINQGTPVIYPRLVPYSHDPNISVIQRTEDNGDGTRSLIAMVTNPAGFVPNADQGGTWSIGKSTFADLQFAVILRDTNDLADGWESNFWLEAADSYYVDTDGNTIAGVAPVLGRSF